MGDIRQFGIECENFGKEAERFVGKVVRATALKVFRDVIAGSPVDTGRFRASWFVGIGSRSEQIAPERAKGSTAGQESMSRLLADLSPETVTGKEPVILSNNLPYGPALAEGHSKQAPNGWIDAAVMRARMESEQWSELTFER